MKITKFIVLGILSLIFLGIILLFEIEDWPAGSSIAGILIGFSLPGFAKSIQDLFDTTNWKVSQRKLERGGFISGDTIIRISFAYLYRIKIGNKYLLVKNERGTGKFQPVGGVYKLFDNEKMELKNRYQVKDDNKIPSEDYEDLKTCLEPVVQRTLRKEVSEYIQFSERKEMTIDFELKTNISENL